MFKLEFNLQTYGERTSETIEHHRIFPSGTIPCVGDVFLVEKIN